MTLPTVRLLIVTLLLVDSAVGLCGLRHWQALMPTVNIRRIVAMEIALEAEVALGRHELAAAELESAVREHPYRERLWYLLAEALLRDGRRVEALRTCERLRDTLAEVGMQAGDELLDLGQRILGVRSGDELAD